MKDYRFVHASARLLATLAVLIAFAPVTAAIAVEKDTHAERTELRIKDLHAKLKITAAQEDQWSKVAQVMRDNAKALDVLTQARMDHANKMTAVDDLKSYGEITDAHADGIKKLTGVFADLYGGMSEAQKKEADALFRTGVRRREHQMAAASK